MIAPEQAATTPARIIVLPKLNSLIGIPYTIAARPANSRPVPAPNNTAIIEPTPGPRAHGSQPRCHDNVILCGSPTANAQTLQNSPGFYGNLRPIPPTLVQETGTSAAGFPRCNGLLRCTREIRPQLPITW